VTLTRDSASTSLHIAGPCDRAAECEIELGQASGDQIGPGYLSVTADRVLDMEPVYNGCETSAFVIFDGLPWCRMHFLARAEENEHGRAADSASEIDA
jgi:hypothetical protein